MPDQIMPDQTKQSSQYIPTLDGWRAVSIALVILHHCHLHSSLPVAGYLLQRLYDVGEVGVELFFAISGLLICSRLLDEEQRTGSISIRNFYLRRFFRILPAALAYLAVIGVLGALHVIPLPALDWWSSLLFCRNYAMMAAYLHHSPLAEHWYTGHFWSLSIEEHFYLLLPSILVIFRKRRLWMIGGFAAGVTGWRWFLAHCLHQDYQFSFRTDTHLDALLIPAMIALVCFPLLRNRSARRWIPAWSFPLLLIFAAILVTTTVPFFYSLQAMVLPLLILSTVLHPKAWPGALLEWRPLRFVGAISFSLYLWQQLFLGVNLAGSPPALAFLRQAPVNLLVLAVCALCSYYLIEKPCIRFGHIFVAALDARRDLRDEPVAIREERALSLPPKQPLHTAS